MSIPTRKTIHSLAELKAIIGEPRPINLQKTIHYLDDAALQFIDYSPFCLLASYNREHDHLDISPKGDTPGFVKVLDEHTLLFPERPGNKLIASLSNILTHASVSLIFIVPGKKETLRIRGCASIIQDTDLSKRCEVNGKAPKILLEIAVKDAFFHCAKCMIRSQLWQPGSWSNTDHLPNLAQLLARYSQQDALYSTIEKAVAQNYQNELY